MVKRRNILYLITPDERPIFHADDEEIFDQTEIQVHLFTRKNPQQYKKDH